MRVGIDISPITATRTGVGNYCFYLVKHLMSLPGGVTLCGFSSGRVRPSLDGLPGPLPCVRLPIPTRVLYHLWTWFHTPKVDWLLGGVDVYHATNYFLPPVRRAKRVVTIHDLAFLAAPETASPRITGPFSRGIRRFAREADAILTYSESTKRDIIRFLDTDGSKITVAPMAVDEGFAPAPREAAQERVRRQYGIPLPFLLFVSTLEPRKNVVGLLRAFHLLLEEIPHHLVLIGSVGWNAAPIFEALRLPGLAARVVRPGFIPHHELPAFYSAADAFVFPTLYEGFGLPLLEALTCGCPVVTCENSSVPEVTGGAAVYAAPENPRSIADAVLRVLGDAGLREDLIRRGQTHAAGYSWEACAQATLDVYRKAAGQ